MILLNASLKLWAPTLGEIWAHVYIQRMRISNGIQQLAFREVAHEPALAQKLHSWRVQLARLRLPYLQAVLGQRQSAQLFGVAAAPQPAPVFFTPLPVLFISLPVLFIHLPGKTLSGPKLLAYLVLVYDGGLPTRRFDSLDLQAHFVQKIFV